LNSEIPFELKPSILLLDLTIPRLQGLEVIRRLRDERQTKIIIVTMHAQPPYIIESLKAGASRYVVKGDQTAELISAIHSV
jgi:two-component system response regulator NreC